MTSARPGLLVIALGAALMLVAGCSLLGGTSDPTAITYNLPTTIVVERGREIPGTGIIFDRVTEQGAYLLIKGQQALKRTGDSVSFKGSPVAGTNIDLALRVLTHNESQLRVVGTAKVAVTGINPQPGVVRTISAMRYSGPVIYTVRRGERIPGTTISYEGRGEDGAQLGGVGDYPFRKEGDSVLWEGTLRDGVYLRLDVRAVQFDDRNLRVAGLATIWVGE